MAKRGPKGTSNLIKINQGTYQPCRSKSEVRKTSGSNEDLDCPAWLSDLAKELWTEKVTIYDRSGLNVSDNGHALAQYCALEADLIGIYKKKEIPPMAMISAHRIWAAEFFDTPASGHLKTGGKLKSDEWDGI